MESAQKWYYQNTHPLPQYNYKIMVDITNLKIVKWGPVISVLKCKYELLAVSDLDRKIKTKGIKDYRFAWELSLQNLRNELNVK